MMIKFLKRFAKKPSKAEPLKESSNMEKEEAERIARVEILKKVLMAQIGDTRQCPECGHSFVPKDGTQKVALEYYKAVCQVNKPVPFKSPKPQTPIPNEFHSVLHIGNQKIELGIKDVMFVAEMLGSKTFELIIGNKEDRSIPEYVVQITDVRKT
jgi:hypothetical protein